jgi:alginate O-acetyltransferase complex protein AlgI
MVFSSILFLFLFLPVVLSGYYFLLILHHWFGKRPLNWMRASNCFLLAASVIFYAWGEFRLIGVMVATILIDYTCSLIISGAYRGGEVKALASNGSRTRAQKTALVLSIVSNLSLLAFFKYFHFGVENYNLLMERFGFSNSVWNPVLRVTLPLGISFYTFESMSYTIDVFRGEIKATRNLIDFACFVTLFPHLIAGPIVRYKAIADQLIERHLRLESVSYGVQRFIVGLGKKVLIANQVALAADQIFSLPPEQLTAGTAWLGVCCYTLQIYYDFSGYSDMAIGMGRMLGFTILENFSYPYIASSIQEFWRRWHISLSTWFRDYVYKPLGGSRHSVSRTYGNLLVVFFLCGLWHGAKWTFVVWGLYHGFFLIAERLGLNRVLANTYRPIRHVYSLLVVITGWIIFRADSLAQSGAFIKAMTGFAAGNVAANHASFMSRGLLAALAFGILFSLPVVPYFEERFRRPEMQTAFSFGYTGLLLGIFLASALTLAGGTYNPFIYFRF